jgi:tetratricopeptide (TPR) repeat protein
MTRRRQFFCGPLLWLACFSVMVAAIYQAHGSASAPKEEFRAAARRGRAVVLAVYAFRRNHGLWPCSLDELVPDYLNAAETRIWDLHLNPDGRWHLTCYLDLPDNATRYRVAADGKGAWVVTDGIYEAALGVEQALPVGPELPQDERIRRQVELLRRRTREMRPAFIHYKGLVSCLVRQGDLRAARDDARSCLRIWPDHWWPNTVLAEIDRRLGDVDGAQARLRKWAESHNDFTHRLFLVDFLYRAGRKAEARAALDSASALPLADLDPAFKTTGEDAVPMATVFAWNGALLGYRESWYDTALAVCNCWEEHYRAEQCSADAGFLIIRSACHLAQGRPLEASHQLKLYRNARANDGNKGWIEEVTPLEMAVSAKDRAFRFSAPDWRGELPPLFIQSE